MRLEFSSKDLGPVIWILGIVVDENRDNKSVLLHQRKYIRDLVERFGLEDAPGRDIPQAGGDDKPSEDSPVTDASTYRSLVGSLLYAAVATRPDIVETVSRLCKAVHAPTEADMKKAKRCLLYLKATEDIGIQFTGHDALKAYCDSDWAGPSDRRLSRSSYAVMLNNGCRGATIHGVQEQQSDPQPFKNTQEHSRTFKNIQDKPKITTSYSCITIGSVRSDGALANLLCCDRLSRTY